MNNAFQKRSRQRRPKAINRSKVSKGQVKQMIISSMKQVRPKYLTTAIANGADPTATGILYEPTLPAQGVTNGEREADSLAIDLIELRFICGILSSDDIIRIVCVQARASTTLTIDNNAAPTTGVFDLGVEGTVDITSFINYNAQNELFHVLLDKTYTVSIGASNAIWERTFRLLPKVKTVNFSPGTTTPLCGGIYWMIFSASANVSASLNQRLVYHDL